MRLASAQERPPDADLANTYSDVVPKILGRAIAYLRANSLMPRLANRDYDGAAAQRGDTINVPVPPTITTVDITPGYATTSTTDITLSTTPVTLSYHKEAPFYLTDKQRHEIMENGEEMAVMSALASLCDAIDLTILTAMDVGASNAHGTAGTTPFATLALATAPLVTLDVNKAAKGQRRVIMDPLANGNLLGLAGFTSRDYVGDVTAMTQGGYNGNVNIGASWWMSQQCPSHTAGTGASYLVNNGSGIAVGGTTIACDTGSGTILAGDVVSFAADTTNKYVVATALSGGSFTIASPGVKVAIPDNNAITVSATHRANFAFDRNAIVFASRPFLPSAANVMMDQVTDPVTGLTVRLEITREKKQDRWSLDALWGTKVVRPEGVVKIMG